ncbi:MAG: asparagine synthase (glutamine-hydrolyzing) [Bacteroidota bacterium]
MCGINGVFGLEKIQEPKQLIDKMNNALKHRGPDAAGVFSNEHVALGHRRLAIIDLDERANQPMKSADGRYTLTYNGELYNFRELKEQLKKYNFHSESDTEVILAAFSEWGIDALKHFNGMFAFAIWDDWEEQLFLCRDRIGIKPLYYAQANNSLVFSSELRALLASELIPRKANPKSITDYMRYATVHAPETIISNVYTLLPGHYLHVTDTSITSKKYFQFGKNSEFDPAKDISLQIREGLYRSVEQRLVADVEYGAFLSGGIDSSLLVGIMSDLRPGKVNTFSVVFEEEAFSEAKYAGMVAEKFSSQHNEIKLKIQDLLDVLPEALGAMDHPSGDGPNSYLVSKKTREQGIKMAISGLGGDELFGGYDLFKYCASISQKKWVTSFPLFLRKMAGSLYANVRSGAGSQKVKDVLVQDYFDLEYIYPNMRRVLRDDDILKLTGENQLSQNKVFQIGQQEISYESEAFHLPYLSKISLLEFNTYMSNVLLRDTDQMSMASALEVRVPFLDHHFVDLVLAIEDSVKYPHSPKKLLVDAFDGFLPSEIVNRRKMGFTFPWKEWMKKDLRQFCEEKLQALSARTFISERELMGLWKRFLNGDEYITWSRIWHLIVLEDWLQKNSIEA